MTLPRKPTRAELRAIAAPKRAKRQRATERRKAAPKPEPKVIQMIEAAPNRRRVHGMTQPPPRGTPSRWVREAMARQELERIAAEAAKAGG
jgi:hypothetical protein